QCRQRPDNALPQSAEGHRETRRLYPAPDEDGRTGRAAACESEIGVSGGRGRASTASRPSPAGACAIWNRRCAESSGRPEPATRKVRALCKSWGRKEWPRRTSTRKHLAREELRQSQTRQASRFAQRASAPGRLVRLVRAAL